MDTVVVSDVDLPDLIVESITVPPWGGDPGAARRRRIPDRQPGRGGVGPGGANRVHLSCDPAVGDDVLAAQSQVTSRLERARRSIEPRNHHSSHGKAGDSGWSRRPTPAGRPRRNPREQQHHDLGLGDRDRTRLRGVGGHGGRLGSRGDVGAAVRRGHEPPGRAGVPRPRDGPRAGSRHRTPAPGDDGRHGPLRRRVRSTARRGRQLRHLRHPSRHRVRSGPGQFRADRIGRSPRRQTMVVTEGGARTASVELQNLADVARPRWPRRWSISRRDWA